jgi:hypothetical protein
MKTSAKFGKGSRASHGITGVTTYLPIDWVLDHLQSVIVNLQLFGLGTGVIVGLVPWASFFTHSHHSAAVKGAL